ncbi:MAG TPA: hypothetical protein PKK99_13970, partial [Bacteroidia bacterium]|nr:hypothetical protein [Bacteroidia bacterium]
MNGFVEQNAISNRIEKLRTLWAEATKDKSKFVFRWYVKGDEARLIQGWYTLEGSEHGIFPELFLRFDSNMLRYEEYASNLVAELTEKFEVDKEECAAAGINISFVPNPESNSNKRSLLPLYFSDNLEKFADALPDFKENVYVLLYPGDLQNTATAYKQWIFDLVENSTFKRLKLVLLDTDEFPMFEQVTKSFPKICTTLQPDLKMDEAMRQMASAGNPAAPEVQFRKLFV